MAHHNAPEDEAEDFLAAFAELPEVLQSAALKIIRAAQALHDEQAVETKAALDALVQPGGTFAGVPAQFVAAAANVVEAHYEELRADNP
ncbi:hypothetical protein ACPCG0_14440 [Propionibacteriaceae bacterium Y1923]|uniref:hypothetical protein n=1 Tax=Aestuariimicrobium sp. Y1814 TaxID=3418742 RepID=UPI003C239BF5